MLLQAGEVDGSWTWKKRKSWEGKPLSRYTRKIELDGGERPHERWRHRVEDELLGLVKRVCRVR